MVTTSFSGAIHELIPQIRDRREEIEEARRLPPDLVDALAATRVFRLAVPRELGGDEADPADQMRAVELLSEADGSTGWCAAVALGASMAAGFMSEPGAREVFANPARPKALVAEPAGQALPDGDGFRISGRWRFASGITHADWVVLGSIVIRNGQPSMTPNGPEVIHTYIPIAQVTVHDTWHVSGLCGTGSHDVSAANVYVPRERVFSLFMPNGFTSAPLYRTPTLSIVAAMTAIVAVGIARAALNELCDVAVSKTPAMSMARLSEKPAMHYELARAEAALGGARSYLYEAVDDLWQTAASGREPTMRQRAHVRLASAQATETAARVARSASTLAGSVSVYRSSSLQRHARDADVITHHFTQAPHVWEYAGRALMGLHPGVPVF